MLGSRYLFRSCGFFIPSVRFSVGLRVLQARAIMVNNNEVLERLEQRAKQADELVELLKAHLSTLQKAAEKQQSTGSQAQIESLKRENEKLKGEADKLKKELAYWEIRNGVKQVALPSVMPSQQTPVATPPAPSATPTPAPEQIEQQQDKKGNKKAEKKGKADKPKKNAEAEMSVSRLDFRIGKVMTVKKHPDADSLFVEEIDVGEGHTRTICSGLVGHVEMSVLQDAMVVVMCNLKPVKMRGILSQGMVMCAHKDGMWSVLAPPAGAVQGDKITFEGYPGEPDQQLNPKKKVWETLAPDFKTNSEGIPVFRGVPFMIPNKGVCTSIGIKDGIVR